MSGTKNLLSACVRHSYGNPGCRDCVLYSGFSLVSQTSANNQHLQGNIFDHQGLFDFFGLPV
jgi:hypothetical protein